MADVEFKFSSNKDLILAQTEEAIKTALETVGVQAQAHATAEITGQGAILTGRLKASITFAVSGDPARQYTYTSENSHETFTDLVEGAGDTKDHTLYLGTNVKYATYVENGTGTNRKIGARPFIRPAVENWISQYKQIFEQELSKIGK